MLRRARALGFATRASVFRMSDRPDLDRERPRRPPSRVRRRLRRPHRAGHGRRRLHGLAPHRRARRDRRRRPRLRACDLERRAQQHLAPAQPAEGEVRRPDRQDVDRLPDQGAARHGLGQAVHLPSRRPGPRRRVVAPAVRDDDGEHDRDAEPAPVRRRLGARAGEVRHGRHLGGVRQRARERRAPPRLRRRGRADPARALADQPEVDLRDREGRSRLPDDELPRRVRRPRRRHAHVQQLRAAPEPALRHRHDHHAGARRGPGSSWARSSRCATSASAPTASAATSPSPRRASRATSTSTARARTSRWPTGPI